MFKPFSEFVFRSPLLPFNHLSHFLLEEGSLIYKLSQFHIKEAIYISSPILYEEIQKVERREITEEKEISRITNSVVRYISRMSTRPTPFGLFAGSCVGKLGEKTNLSIKESIQRTTRLDMQYLCALFYEITKKEEISKKIKYYPNSSIYVVGEKIRYIETLYINNKRKYQIAEVSKSSYLTKICKENKYGMYLEDLVSLLACEEVSRDDAENFIYEVIDSQILIPELSQSVTGDDYLSRIIKTLQKSSYMGKELNMLININYLLKKLDIIESKEKSTIYDKIIKILNDIKIHFDEKYLFQVDMGKIAINSEIGGNIIDSLEKAMLFLNKITPVIENDTLKRFQMEFYKRYEDKEVPLMEVLDPEMGIGYPPQNGNGDIAPLIDDFFLPQRYSHTSTSDKLSSILLNRTIRCLKERKAEIILDDEDVKGFEVSWNDLPPTLYTMFEIINGAQFPLIRLSSYNGSCAANLLGRFSHTDSRIDEFVKKITLKEQLLMPDIILAEIVHLPEARVGNILSRPHIREYEILYLSHSDLPAQCLFHMSDLMLSIKQGRLIIRSKKMGKEIIPRLTTAHNYRNNTMPVYRFLCEMQNTNGRGGLYFSWGQLQGELAFKPRVRYSNVILSPASWIVRTKDIKHLFDIKNDIELVNQITEWRTTILLPERSLMPDGDNELFVDWKSALSIRALFAIIRNRPQMTFTEFLFEPNEAVVKDTSGNIYTNECIVAFYKNDKQ